MSRAFVSENDGWNMCMIRRIHCQDASLRGECDRVPPVCKYPPEENTGEEGTGLNRKDAMKTEGRG